MSKFNAVVDKVLFWLLSAALTALVVICFVQVVARYVFSASFSWAEEVSIIIMVWGTWGGASLAVKRRSHLRILIVVDRFRPGIRLALNLALNALGIVFLVVVAVTSKTIIDGMANMTLFSLPSVPMSILYISVPVGCVLMIYYFLRGMFSEWKELRTKPEGRG
jgi:TRAP-type C4-dicarboxylate transport system permease small subunit